MIAGLLGGLEGHDSPSVADCFIHVAVIYQDQGKYKETLEMHTKALKNKTHIYGGDSHLDVAQTRENMAYIHYKQGHYDQALEIYKSVLEAMIRVCGEDSLGVAKSLSGIGNVLGDMGKRGACSPPKGS